MTTTLKHLPDIERTGRIDATGKVLVWTRCGQEVPSEALGHTRCPGVNSYGHGLSETTVHLGCCCDRCYCDVESVRILS